MCDFSRVSAWFCDEKISLKKSCFYLYIRRKYELCWNQTGSSKICKKIQAGVFGNCLFRKIFFREKKKQLFMQINMFLKLLKDMRS